MDKKRRQLFRFIIVLFWTILTLVIVSVLILTRTIHFDWSDNIIANYNYEKNKGKDQRILVIGDSQLEKWPIPHCLNNDIEDFCIKNNIGLLNAAHHGFGALEYLDLVKKHTDDFKPNLIIIFYYTGNDLTDLMYKGDKIPSIPTHEVWRVNPGDKLPDIDSIVEAQRNQEPRRITDQEKLEILRQSTFDWEYFKAKGIDTTLIRYAQNRILHPNMIGPEYVNPHVLVMGAWQPNYLFDNNAINSPASKKTWYTITRIFEEIVQYAHSRGSLVCFVTIPSTVQIDSSHFEFYRKAGYVVSDELLTADKPQQLIGDFTQAGNIPYVNLLPHFKNAPNTAELYFENDDHLSSVGHKLAYEIVEEKILKPFLKNELQKPDVNGIKKFHKNYTDWAIEYTAQWIREDETWFSLVQQKAKEKQIPLDSMIMIDARYAVESESK